MDLGVIDASQDCGWRRKLFAAPLYREFPIDSDHTAGLLEAVATAVRRHGLECVVCRVPQSETPFDEPGWEGCEFFRFRAVGTPIS
jgi:hypothetical protein